jgi:hypothetical protein
MRYLSLARSFLSLKGELSGRRKEETKDLPIG